MDLTCLFREHVNDPNRNGEVGFRACFWHSLRPFVAHALVCLHVLRFMFDETVIGNASWKSVRSWRWVPHLVDSAPNSGGHDPRSTQEGRVAVATCKLLFFLDTPLLPGVECARGAGAGVGGGIRRHSC
jgi:hypothetical protein